MADASEEHDTWVLLHPHSRTNSTSKFQVVNYQEWIEYIEGKRTGFRSAGMFAEYTDADRVRDEMNHPS